MVETESALNGTVFDGTLKMDHVYAAYNKVLHRNAIEPSKFFQRPTPKKRKRRNEEA